MWRGERDVVRGERGVVRGERDVVRGGRDARSERDLEGETMWGPEI